MIDITYLPEQYDAALDEAEGVHYLTRLQIRYKVLESYWITNHPDWSAENRIAGPCGDCSFAFMAGPRSTPFSRVRKVETFFDAPEARHLVCERCMVRRMRDFIRDEDGNCDDDLIFDALVEKKYPLALIVELLAASDDDDEEAKGGAEAEHGPAA